MQSVFHRAYDVIVPLPGPQVRPTMIYVALYRGHSAELMMLDRRSSM